jgi:Leucine-rich repeat (LRR) protein
MHLRVGLVLVACLLACSQNKHNQSKKVISTSLSEALQTPEKVTILNLTFSPFKENPEINGLPEAIGTLINLEELIIEARFASYPPITSEPQITSSGKIETLPESIGNLRKLRVLTLQAVGLKALPESFTALKNLQELDISFNEFEFAPLEAQLAKLPNLKRIRIYTLDYPKQQASIEAFQAKYPTIQVEYNTQTFYRQIVREAEEFNDSFSSKNRKMD